MCEVKVAAKLGGQSGEEGKEEDWGENMFDALYTHMKI